MITPERYLRQLELANLIGLAHRKEAASNDLGRKIVPVYADLPKQFAEAAARILPGMVGNGLAVKLGHCTSTCSHNNDGIVRRYVAANLPAIHARILELKTLLGEDAIIPTSEQIYQARPRDIHLPIARFHASPSMLFDPFLDNE